MYVRPEYVAVHELTGWWTYIIWAFSFAPGVYSIVIGLFWFLVPFLSNFTAPDKSQEGANSLPPFVSIPLSILTLHWVRAPLIGVMAVPMFFSIPTQLCMVSLFIAALLNLIAAIRGEAWAKVTGIRNR